MLNYCRPVQQTSGCPGTGECCSATLPNELPAPRDIRRFNTQNKMWKNDEYREMMNKGASDRWKNDEYRKKMLSYLNSEEHKNKIIKLFKGKKRTNEEKEKISKNHGSNQPVSVDGMIYSSITVASVLIPMNRDKLKNRLNSKHFPQYYKIKKEV